MKGKAAKYVNIPIFIPEMACPQKCIYCHQQHITAVYKEPSKEEVRQIIDTHLSCITDAEVEIAFFGGNFTGIPIEAQKQYLQTAASYLKIPKVKGIRVSTRPDYISHDILALLKSYGVTSIELGVQSTDDAVLKATGRGYKTIDIKNAAKMILDTGIALGLQMMTGLPGDTAEKSIKTAYDIIDYGASMTRIYPLIVLKDTPLAQLYNKGKYHPPSLEETVELCKTLYSIFRKAGVKVLKMGLHPSENLLYNDSIVAGPYHHSFAELVYTELWRTAFETIKPGAGKMLSITVNPVDYNHAIGYKAANKKRLLKNFDKVKFYTNNQLKRFDFKYVHSQ